MRRSSPSLPGNAIVKALAIGVAVLITAQAGPLRAQQYPSRQVTLFGIMAVPGSNAVDPQLKSIAPELQRYWPGYGFKLLEVQSRRLAVGQSISCQKLNGFEANASLLDPLDANGKVQLRFDLGAGGQLQSSTIVATPPNQPFFFDKQLSNGARLLIGIGAR